MTSRIMAALAGMAWLLAVAAWPEASPARAAAPPSAAPEAVAAPAAKVPASAGGKAAAPVAAPVTVAAAPAPAAPTPAAAVAPAPDEAAILQADDQLLARIQNHLQTTSDDGRLAAMGARAEAIEAAADAVIAARDKDIGAIDQALKRYTPRRGRTPTEADRRGAAPLLAGRAPLQTELAQAQTVSSAASYTFALVAERRREGFSARVFERSPSPLSPSFWTSLADAAGDDVSRLLALARNAVDGAAQAPEPRGLLEFGLGLLVAAGVLFPARWWLETLGGRRIERQGARQKVAGSGRAVWITAVDTGLPTLAAAIVQLAADWSGLLSTKADSLATAGVVAVAWGSAILAIGRALATEREADRRLLGMADATADKLRVFLWVVALITGAGFLLTRLNYVIGASVAATIAANCVLSLAYAAVAGLLLVSFGRGRAPAASDDAMLEAARAPAWTLLSLTLTVAILVTVGAVLGGYTTLAALVSNQIFWLSLLAAAAYLLLRFIDDLVAALFREHGWAERALFALFSLRRTTIRQIGLLVSAALQLAVLIGAIGLALTPFGQSGDQFLAHFSQLGRTIHIGSATISPGAIAAGLATLAVGIGIVHLVRGWVVRRYLPVTGWDAGLSNSVSTGVGYLGVGVSLLCALGAMGLGFQQIALVASALSVGIGFGLQQVVQNFVSGIILLVERPVKVGDWVTVDGVEGDIRRIRVRATEIQMFDRTTVIVPNSDLITKQVQNKSLGDPRGRIKLELSIASAADARKARELIVQAAQAKQGVLSEPPPAVYIDSLAGGGAVNFVCYMYVASPRDVVRLKSELYFDIVDVLLQSAVPLIGVGGPATVIFEPGPDMKSILADAASRLPEADEAAKKPGNGTSRPANPPS